MRSACYAKEKHRFFAMIAMFHSLPMPFVQVTIRSRQGVHARPASVFVNKASTYASEILLESAGTKVNGKSIMGLLMLALGPGSTVRIEAHGQDEQKALRELAALLGGEEEPPQD